MWEVLDTVTPWVRANLAGFSTQPLMVLVMASISRAVMTKEQERGRQEGGERGQGDNALPTGIVVVVELVLWVGMWFKKDEDCK